MPNGVGQLQQRAVEVLQQPAAVAEAGELVGGRLGLARGEDRAVGAERQREARDDREQRERVEHAGDAAQAGELVVDADEHRDERGGDGEREQAQAGRVDLRPRAARLPGGVGDRERREAVGEVEDAAGRPAAGDRADDVERVGEPEHDERRAERQPRAVEPPALHRADDHDEAGEQQVGHRQREREAGAGVHRLLPDGLEDQRPRRAWRARARRPARRATRSGASRGRAPASARPGRRAGTGTCRARTSPPPTGTAAIRRARPSRRTTTPPSAYTSRPIAISSQAARSSRVTAARHAANPPASANRMNMTQSSSSALCQPKHSRATIRADPSSVVTRISGRATAACGSGWRSVQIARVVGRPQTGLNHACAS